MANIKKGDILELEVIVQQGEQLVYGHNSVDEVHTWMGKSAHDTFGTTPSYRVGADPINEGRFSAFALTGFIKKKQAKVSWVIGDEVALQYDDGGYVVLNLSEVEGKWRVIKEATASYQSSVEHLSDEELRASIEHLRSTRTPGVNSYKKKGVSEPKETVDKNDPMAKLVANMTPEQKQELYKKLGLV